MKKYSRLLKCPIIHSKIFAVLLYIEPLYVGFIVYSVVITVV